jgi:uncharacterized protein YjbI with pentapeptide repeats
VGEAGLTEAIRLNRDTEAYSEDKATIAMLQSTQQVISHFLRHRSEYGWINRVNFDGIRLVNPGFNSTDLSGVKLRNSVLRSAGLCSTQLRGADLSLTVFSGGILMDADFSDARVDGTRFMHNWEEGSGRLEMHRAKFDRAHAAQIEISNAELRAASFRDAVLLNAKLSGVDLSRSEMRKADLTGADLMMTDLTEARLVGARLVDAQFYGAIMYKANLSGADLSGSKLFYTFEEKPYEPGGSDAGRASRGAYVLDADFTGASGLSPETLRYLCRFGAVGVPGGCDGVEKEQISPPKPTWSGSTSRFCI